MRHYETMFIVKPTLTEEEVRVRIEFFKETILKNGGNIETCLDMGMRNLAYPIKKNFRGYYFGIYFRAEPVFIKELERLYGINEDILRFIVIKYESKSEQAAWQTLVNRANKKEKPKALKKEDGVYRERPRYPNYQRDFQRDYNRDSNRDFGNREGREYHRENRSFEGRSNDSRDGRDSRGGEHRSDYNRDYNNRDSKGVDSKESSAESKSE